MNDPARASLRELSGSLVELLQSVQFSPGSVHARESVLRRVLPALNDLAADPGADDATLTEVAEAYAAMGRVLGHPYTANLGRPAEAAKAYRQALAVAPPGTSARRLAAWRYELALTLGAMRDYDSVDAELVRAAALITGTISEEDGFEPWSEVAEIHRLRVATKLNAGAADAVDTARGAARSLAFLAERSPRDHDDAMNASAAHVFIGMMLLEAGEYAASVDAMDRGLRAALAGASFFPGSMRAPQAAGNCRRHRARALLAQGNLQGAAEGLTAALENFRACSAFDSSRVDISDITCTTLIELAQVHILAGRLLEGLGLLDESLAARGTLLAENPDNYHLRRNATQSYLTAARLTLEACNEPGLSVEAHDARLAAADARAAAAAELATELFRTGSPADASFLPMVEKLRAEIAGRRTRE